MTTQQAIILYSVIDALKKQFDKENYPGSRPQKPASKEGELSGSSARAKFPPARPVGPSQGAATYAGACPSCGAERQGVAPEDNFPNGITGHRTLGIASVSGDVGRARKRAHERLNSTLSCLKESAQGSLKWAPSRESTYPIL